jgi:hypothetical protein
MEIEPKIGDIIISNGYVGNNGTNKAKGKILHIFYYKIEEKILYLIEFDVNIRGHDGSYPNDEDKHNIRGKNGNCWNLSRDEFELYEKPTPKPYRIVEFLDGLNK